MKSVLGLAAGLCLTGVASAEIILTGVLDGDLSGGTPKVVELYVNGTENLSEYKFAYQQNSGTAWTYTGSGMTGTFTDEFVYLVDSGNEDEFLTSFGSSGDFANVVTVGSIAHNGDDRVGIASSADVLLDSFGVAGEDGSGKAWEYQDGYAYRKNGTGPDTVFNIANWNVADGGVDGLDAAGHGAAVPFGTYAIPEPMTLSFISIFGAGMLFARRCFAI